MPRRRVIGIAAAVLAAMAAVTTAIGAGALSLTPAPGATGYDVSYPQCTGKLPTNGAFAIVGVTKGLPWSLNPCLATKEWPWAASRATPGLYMNTANPAPTSSFYWSKSGERDPALCVDSTSRTDPGCAYNYGWHAAANALDSAISAIGAIAKQVPWWLDVETANSWNGDGLSNAADIQGAIDYLRSHGVPLVGIYSTGYQWGVITGGYTVGSAASYQQAWSAWFTPLYPLSEAPTWIAGASSLKNAAANCKTTFTGVPALLAQYRASGGLDGDLACPTPTAATTRTR